jgi:hypothetical protein
VRRAVVYLRGGALFIRAESETTTHAWIETGPCTVLPLATTPDILGNAIEVALAESRTGVPHPHQKSWPEVIKPTLDAAKVRTWAAFARTARAVGVRASDDVLIESFERRGSAFYRVPEKHTVVPSAASPDQTGRAILKALELAQ